MSSASSPSIIPSSWVCFTHLLYFYYSFPGQWLNYGAFVLVVLLVTARIGKGLYTTADLINAFYHHVVAWLAMVGTMLLVVTLVIQLDLVMCWYKMPELLGPLYVLPMLLAGITVHSYFADKDKV